MLTEKDLKPYFDRTLVYEDYKLLARVANASVDKKDRDTMAALKPFFDRDWVRTDRHGAVWLTEVGTRTLQAAGWSKKQERAFFEEYPRLLDSMER